MKHVDESTPRDTNLCYVSCDWIEQGVLDLGLVTVTLPKTIKPKKYFFRLEHINGDHKGKV